MWIRNQWKRVLVNTNEVYVENNVVLCGDYQWTLGRYSTEEKAMKVLDMIQYNIERLKFAEMDPDANLSYDVIFEMPKDEDVK